MQVIEGLGTLVEDYGNFAKHFKAHPNDKLSSYFAPLAARSMIEAACSILIARIDPMRVIYSARAQNSPSYDRGKQQPSAVKWTGDIISPNWTATPRHAAQPNNGAQGVGAANAASVAPTAAASATVPASTTTVAANPSAPPLTAPPPAVAVTAAQGTVVGPSKANAHKANWDGKIDGSKIPRSLLSPNSCEIVWAPALQRLTDWQATAAKQSTWLTELTSMAPEDVGHELPSVGHRIYSELSKGIHPEFIVQRQTIFDDATLQTLITEATAWISKVALLSHFCYASNLSHPNDTAADLFIAIEVAML